jgi:hypothetical protein
MYTTAAAAATAADVLLVKQVSQRKAGVWHGPY